MWLTYCSARRIAHMSSTALKSMIFFLLSAVLSAVIEKSIRRQEIASPRCCRPTCFFFRFEQLNGPLINIHLAKLLWKRQNTLMVAEENPCEYRTPSISYRSCGWFQCDCAPSRSVTEPIPPNVIWEWLIRSRDFSSHMNRHAYSF